MPPRLPWHPRRSVAALRRERPRNCPALGIAYDGCILRLPQAAPKVRPACAQAYARGLQFITTNVVRVTGVEHDGRRLRQAGDPRGELEPAHPRPSGNSTTNMHGGFSGTTTDALPDRDAVSRSPPS